MPMSIRSVITRFGGIQPMAKRLGHRNHTTVQGWWDRETIPALRMPEVLDAASEHGLDISADELVPRAAALSVKARTDAVTSE